MYYITFTHIGIITINLYNSNLYNYKKFYYRNIYNDYKKYLQIFLLLTNKYNMQTSISLFSVSLINYGTKKIKYYANKNVTLYHYIIMIIIKYIKIVHQIIIIYTICTEFSIHRQMLYNNIQILFLHCISWKWIFFENDSSLSTYHQIYFIRIIFTIGKTYLSVSISPSNHCQINESCHDQKFKYSIG